MSIFCGILCHRCKTVWDTGILGEVSHNEIEVKLAAKVNGWIINESQRLRDCPCNGCNRRYTCEECVNLTGECWQKVTEIDRI